MKKQSKFYYSFQGATNKLAPMIKGCKKHQEQIRNL